MNTAEIDRKYLMERRCCTECDRKKVCHVCKQQTLFACADCQINFGATVYVCSKPDCRDAHETKCCGTMSRAGLSDDEVSALQSAVENLRAPERTQPTAEAAWRIASKLEKIAKRMTRLGQPSL